MNYDCGDTYEELKKAGLRPILNYSCDRHPNIGSIVWAGEIKETGEIPIGIWRLINPKFTFSLAYGFYVTADTNLKIQGAGHGTMLSIKSPDGRSRIYWFGCGSVGVDQILIPKQALIDFAVKGKKNKSRYFHYPDLKWFDPYPKNEVMNRIELLTQIEQRLRSEK